jgi:hypothetical protein
MASIELEKEGLCIDAAIIGESLGIDPSAVQARMREGKIRSLCERGVDKDAGRYRLTFFFENRRVRLVLDEQGKIIQRSTVDFGTHQVPAPVQRSGTKHRRTVARRVLNKNG